jgi:hypothetical protein
MYLLDLLMIGSGDIGSSAVHFCKAHLLSNVAKIHRFVELETATRYQSILTALASDGDRFNGQTHYPPATREPQFGPNPVAAMAEN